MSFRGFKSGGGGGQRTPQRGCFNCGEPGHQAMDCPRPRRSSHGNQGSQGSGSGFAAQRSDQPRQDQTPGFHTISATPDQIAAQLNALSLSSLPAPLLTAEDAEAQRKAKRAAKEKNHKDWELAGLNLAARNGNASGTKETGKANFFKLTINQQNQDLRRYRIQLGEINKKVPTKREARRALIQMMLEDNPPTLDQKLWVTDYYTYIISNGKLFEKCGDIEGKSELDVPHRQMANSEPDSDLISTKIVYEGKVKIANLLAHVRADSTSLDRNYLPSQDIQSLNIISWQNIHKDLKWDGGIVGKKFYPATGEVNKFETTISQRQQTVYLIRTGFFTSVRPGDGILLLNINTTTSAFYPAISLSEWLKARCGSPEHATAKQLKELKGLRVTFAGDDKTSKAGKRSVIWEVSLDRIKNKKFVKKGTKGPQKLVTGYLREKYKNLRFNDEALAVNIGGDPPNDQWYPIDTLTIVEWQVVKGILDSMFTRNMLTVAEKKPDQNQKLILNDALRLLGLKTAQNSCQNFGISIDPNFVKFQARFLRSPRLLYGSNFKIDPNPSWNLIIVAQDKKFMDHKSTETSMGIMKISGEGHQNDGLIEDFVHHLVVELARYGVRITPNSIIEVDPGEGRNALQRRGRFSKLLQNAYVKSNNPELVLCLLPSKDATIYSDIKWWGDCNQGVRTLCVTSTAVEKAVGKRKTPTFKGNPVFTKRGSPWLLDQKVLGNLALKFNFKLGGTNHCLAGEIGTFDHTLILGADVTHSGRGLDPGCPSLAGVVGSLDAKSVLYRASARLQSNNTEFIEDLENMVAEHLQAFYVRTNRLPENILFYRDGVSESQFGMVKDAELPQIQRACDRAIAIVRSRAPQGFQIRITLVVVGKRHHTRFFPKDANDRNNHKAGLCVDSDVTIKHQFSFYLQSHYSALGTAKSGHYVVIENGSNYTAARLQEVTNNICFTGSRATTALSICTPARYADILCERLRCYMRPVLEGELRGSLKNNPVADYRKQKLIWGSESGNPWHANMQDIMFYL